jgi:cytochrome P450
VTATRRLLDRWPAAGEVDVTTEMTRLALEVIAQALFGSEVADHAEALAVAVRDFSEAMFNELAAPFDLPDWLPLPSKIRKRRAISTVDHFLRDLIRRRSAAPADRGDLLSMLLLAVDEGGDGRGMTDAQARDEAVALFRAGHDATAAGLTWACQMLATHPGILDRAVAEVQTVAGVRPADIADLPRLEYLGQVVRETLRLYPPAWSLFARKAVEDTELAGYRVPRGSFLYVFPWGVQRNPRYFPRPESFDPDRFAPGRVAEMPVYGYIPFGVGPHVCIGKEFALMQMTLTLATLLQRVRLSPVAGQRLVEPEPHIAVRPRGGLRLRVTPRTGSPVV